MDKSLQKTSYAIRFALTGAVVLFLLKFFATFYTHSVSVMASALDSFMDAGMSLVNLIALYQAAKPPDEEHPYGHGKIESLASLFQSTIIGLLGFLVIYQAVARFFSQTVVIHYQFGIISMVLSLIGSFVIYRVIHRASKKQSSLLVDSEKLHYASDVISHAGVIVILVLVWLTKWNFWDIILSLVMGTWIIWSAWKILKLAVDELLDVRLPASFERNIQLLILSSSSEITGYHRFRSRRVGQKVFIDFHLEMKAQKEMQQAHHIKEDLVRKIKEAYPNIDITIHLDSDHDA